MKHESLINIWLTSKNSDFFIGGCIVAVLYQRLKFPLSYFTRQKGIKLRSAVYFLALSSQWEVC